MLMLLVEYDALRGMKIVHIWMYKNKDVQDLNRNYHFCKIENKFKIVE